MPSDDNSGDNSGNNKGLKDGLTKEQRVLRMVRHVLTDVAKDTVTPAGLKHPLSEQTINGIRECLAMISARERELLEEAGIENTQKPRFVDEPQDHVVVSLTTPKKEDNDS